MAKSAKFKTSRNQANGNGRGNGSHRLVDDVISLTGTLLRGRQEKGADVLQALSSSTREFATSLGEMPQMADSVEGIADRLEGLSEYISNTSMEEIVSDAGDFARRHPLAMLAVTAGIGLAASQYFYSGSGTGTTSSKRGNRAGPRKSRNSKNDNEQSEARN